MCMADGSGCGSGDSLAPGRFPGPRVPEPPDKSLQPRCLISAGLSDSKCSRPGSRSIINRHATNGDAAAAAETELLTASTLHLQQTSPPIRRDLAG